MAQLEPEDMHMCQLALAPGHQLTQNNIETPGHFNT